MHHLPRPHSSPALQHLRRSVSVLSGVLGLCLLLQVILWATIHFGDAERTQIGGTGRSGSVEVVIVKPGSSGQATAVSNEPFATGGLLPNEKSSRASSAATEQVAKPAPAVNPNVVPSKESYVMSRSADVIHTIGVIAALVLMVLLVQGVMIAGGAGVPGVEMAVTACTWGLIVGMMCLPIGHLLPGVPYGGAFMPYDAMQRMSEQYHGKAGVSAMELYGLNLALPLLLLAGLGAAVIRFHLGVEKGVMLVSTSQLDEHVESEIRRMKTGQLGVSRTVAALNNAIGASTPIGPPEMPTIEDEPRSRSLRDGASARPLKRPV